MRRREFITLLVGASVAWPHVAHAQQPAMPVIGFLRSATLTDVPHLVTAFHQGLKESRLCRGSKRRDRIPLCGKSARSIAGPGR